MNGINPTVGVIIPTYNRAELIGQAIDSILIQKCRPDEIVVIDDGSTDATAEVLAAYGDKIHYLYQTNAGKPAALNRAMNAMSADYLWIMDDDDVALPGALEMYLAFLGAHPEVDFCYSACYGFEGDQPPESAAKRLMDCPEFTPAEFFIRVMIAFPFLMQGMLVPTRCYRRVGPFEETLPRNQDYDMILRLSRHFRGGRLAKPTFYWRSHPRARGPAFEQFSPNTERNAVYAKYDRQVFSSLRETLSLGEYLPRGTTEHTVLDKMQRRQARLQRACIMVRHGLFEEAFEDLETAFGDHEAGSPLTKAEMNIFSQMLNVEHWWLREHSQFPSEMGKILRERRAWSALESCAIGLGWRIVRELRSGRYRNAFEMADQLRRLTGVGRLPGVARTALRRRHQHDVGQRPTAPSPP